LLELPIGACRCLFDKRQCADELRGMANGYSGNWKVFDRAQGVDAPIGTGRNLRLAEEIMLAPRCAFGGGTGREAGKRRGDGLMQSMRLRQSAGPFQMIF